MWKSLWLTDWTRTQAGSLFHEAVEIRHLLIQRSERRIFTLHTFGSESLLVFRVFAETIDTKLCNLDWNVIREQRTTGV